MTINEALSLAARLESLARRSYTFGKSVDDIVEELNWIGKDLRDYADRLDRMMTAEMEEEVGQCVTY